MKNHAIDFRTDPTTPQKITTYTKNSKSPRKSSPSQPHLMSISTKKALSPPLRWWLELLFLLELLPLLPVVVLHLDADSLQNVMSRPYVLVSSKLSAPLPRAAVMGRLSEECARSQMAEKSRKWVPRIPKSVLEFYRMLRQGKRLCKWNHE